MRHIKAFENFDSQKNIEIIENCFLDWIDSGQCIGVASELPDTGIYYLDFPVSADLSKKHKDAYNQAYGSLNYLRPKESDEKLYKLVIEEIEEWLNKLKIDLQGDVARCESYGFECTFNDSSGELELIIKKKNHSRALKGVYEKY